MMLHELKIVRQIEGSFAVKDCNGLTLAVFDEYSEALDWRENYVKAVNTSTETFLKVDVG